MTSTDRGPLPGTPVTGRISQRCNNRLGAVYSALYSFWMSRQSALGVGVARRDAYSIIFFDHTIAIAQENDFTSSPDELLEIALRHPPSGGTDYTSALRSTQLVMERRWSTERCDFWLCNALSVSHRAPERQSSSSCRMANVRLQIRRCKIWLAALCAWGTSNILFSFFNSHSLLQESAVLANHLVWSRQPVFHAP
jgi:hypothetical protein